MIDYAEKYREHEAVVDPINGDSPYLFCPLRNRTHDKHVVDSGPGYPVPCGGVAGTVEADPTAAAKRLEDATKYRDQAIERLREAQMTIDRLEPEIAALRAFLTPDDEH